MKTDVRQHDISDCGAACICSVARHYGQDIPLTLIRQASGTNGLGTSIKGMIDACRSLGFRAAGFSSQERDVQALKKVPLPVVLHTVNKHGDLHFVVLYRCGAKKATIMDPAEGRHKKISYQYLHNIWSGHIISIDNDPSSIHDPGFHQTSPLSHSLIFRYVRIACFAKRDILAALPGSFFNVLSGIGSALYLQYIIDVVLPSGDRGLLLFTAAKMLALIICTVTVNLCAGMHTLKAGLKIDASLILEYLRHLFSLPTGFFSGRGTGELNSRIPDAMKIRRLLTESIPGALTGVLLLCGALTLMLTTHRRLAVTALCFIPVYIALTVVILQVSRRLNRKVVESAAQFEKQCIESISTVRNMKYYGCGSSSASVEREYCKLNWNLSRNGKAAVWFGSGADLLNRLLGFAIIASGGIFILKGTLTIGELISFYTLAAWFSAPLSEIAQLGVEINEANLSLERLDDILTLESENESGLECEAVAQDIEFRNIEFSYPGCPTLLSGFNLKIPAGKIVCITGESGCGKSSLAALLMRDVKPTSGNILLGINDISLFGAQSWREYISIVPQEAILSSDSILDNICGGEKNPDINRAAGLLEELGMRDFIVSLPLGMLTPCGEGGRLLSGGQRQRVAMARALWRDPQILILDEATASLDSDSQRFILDKAVKLRDEGRTVIMITHRKDNTEIADLLFHMEGGLCTPRTVRKT